jgi:hypothetical protein
MLQIQTESSSLVRIEPRVVPQKKSGEPTSPLNGVTIILTWPKYLRRGPARTDIFITCRGGAQYLAIAQNSLKY